MGLFCQLSTVREKYFFLVLCFSIHRHVTGTNKYQVNEMNKLLNLLTYSGFPSGYLFF